MNPIQRAIRFAEERFYRIAPDLSDRLADWNALRRHARNAAGWHWQRSRPCPGRRCEAGGAQVGSRVFVVGGYETLDRVHGTVDVFDLRLERWVARWPMPAGMAHTHQGMASDGERFVFVAAGQVGPRCSPATGAVFAIDAETGQIAQLPNLPEPRYAPVAVHRNNRLHVVGGSAPDRHTPCADHWSIAVADGQAVEATWRAEPPIPRPGTHRGYALVDDAILVLGGQEGDVRPHAGDPSCGCNFATPLEVIYPDVYRLPLGATRWERLPDLPRSGGHLGCCATVVGGKILAFSGLETRYTFTDTIQLFDVETGAWRVVGNLPHRFKAGVVARLGRTVFYIAGQRSKSPRDPSPGRVANTVWKVVLPEWV